MDVLDIWVNLVTQQSADSFLGQEENAHIPGYLGSDESATRGVTQLIGVMDELGVATGVLTPGLDRHAAKSLEVADAHPGRFLVAGVLLDPAQPGRNVRRIREMAEHPRFSMVRITPLTSQVAIDDARHYPVYQVCEELGIPVGINVGIPGPRVRSNVQHPERLEGVLDRLPGSGRDRRAHGPSLRRADHELHAEVAEPVPLVHRVRAALLRSRAGEVHEHIGVPRSGDLGERRAVVPDAAVTGGGPCASTRRRRDGALPRWDGAVGCSTAPELR